MQTRLLSILLFISISGIAHSQPECPFLEWKIYAGTKLMILPDSSAYVFECTHVAIDADGAPNAYHPDDIGLDYLANAGYPDRSWTSILVEDPSAPGHPYTQPTGEFAGYFVSKTTLENRSKAEIDPARYVDSRKVPYFVFPDEIYRMKGTGGPGDLGFAINLATHGRTAFVVGDLGPNEPMAEVSIALAERLGGENVNPRNASGAPQGKILYVIFPYSKKTYPWPLAVEEMEEIVDRLLDSIGGIDSILSCEGSL